MRVLIYGAGALGLLMGNRLEKNNDVFYIGKTNQVKTYNILKENEVFEHTFRITNTIEDNNYDFIILAVKTFDIENAINTILNNVINVPIMTIQNGIFTEELLLSKIDKNLVFPIASLIGSNLRDDTIKNFMDNGQKIGYFGEKDLALEFAKVFNESGIDTIVVDDIMRQKWWKFILYCCGGTLNALTQIKEFDEKSIEFSSKLAQEIVDVFQKNTDENLQLIKYEVIEFLKTFKPNEWKASVGEDLKKGKATEIEYLNGYVVKKAEELSKKAPYNESLYNLVKMLEKTKYFTNLN